MAPTPAFAFWCVLFWLVVHRTVAHRWGDVVKADSSREQRWSTVILIANGLLMGTLCFIAGWNGRPVPAVVFLAGNGLAAAGIVLVTWSRRILGRHFSIHLQVDAEHKLVTAGPYGVVRHPIYSGDLLLYLGVPLLSGAWEALVCPLIYLGLAVVRSRKEEVMLGDAYPDYAAYKERTSALVPRVL